MSNSLMFSIFLESVNHHFNLISEHFHHPTKVSVPGLASPCLTLVSVNQYSGFCLHTFPLSRPSIQIEPQCMPFCVRFFMLRAVFEGYLAAASGVHSSSCCRRITFCLDNQQLTRHLGCFHFGGIRNIFLSF